MANQTAPRCARRATLHDDTNNSVSENNCKWSVFTDLVTYEVEIEHAVYTECQPLLYTCSLLAAQAWMLCILLPLMIGDKVPEDEPHWECFLLLVQIVKCCTARVISTASAAFLEVLVDQHHQEFKKCYPSLSITPKMHYMVHLPRLMMM